MTVKYEALRLFLAGTALILTAMLTTPNMSTTEPHILKKANAVHLGKENSIRSKKSKSGLWSLASYHARR